MIKLHLLSIFIFITSVGATAQNIEGKWTGYLDQSADAAKTPGYEVYYKTGLWEKGKITHLLTFTFFQKENNITGEYFIQTRADTTDFAKFKIGGTIDKDILNYKTTGKAEEVIRQGLGFCYNKAKLLYYVKDGYEYLEGNWTGWDALGLRCADAYVVVRRLRTKIETKKDTVIEKQPGVIENRQPVLVTRTFKTTQEFVTVKVWDANTVDGDSISLNLNGKWVLENFELTKHKKEITLQLEPGANYLILYALNLGRIPPNTAALSINDETTKEKIILNSDLTKSEGFKIIRQ